MKIGFLFPGQGSQSIGMGKDLFDKYEEIKEVYKKVHELTGIDVEKLTFEGPEEELNKTANTQMCILTMSLAILKILEKNNIKAEVSAGLSLGEYSALIYSGILSFEEGVKLVQKRGDFMQNLVPDGEWLMSAILGMNEEQVNEVCSKVTKGFAKPVNFNCPGQIVISGDKEGVTEAGIIAKEMGARKVRELKTAGPFHTIKLEKASIELKKYLENVKINEGKSLVVKNINADIYKKEDDIKQILADHITHPVRFSDSLQKMIDLGIDTFIEIGPGKTLSGFVKKIETEKEINILNINNVETLDNVLNNLIK